MKSFTMQPTKQDSVPSASFDNQRVFWSEMERVALRGMDRPESLDLPEISKMCRLAFVAMSLKDGRRLEPLLLVAGSPSGP